MGIAHKKGTMESVRIIPNLEETPLQEESYTIREYTGPLIVGGLAEGTFDGKPMVALALEIGENEFLVKQSTLSLFLDAADALKAKYGDPREQANNGAGHS